MNEIYIEKLAQRAEVETELLEQLPEEVRLEVIAKMEEKKSE